MIDAIGLTAYPLSARFVDHLARQTGTTVRVVAVSELRRSSVFALWRSLRDMRAGRGYVLLEQPDAAPLLPVLKLLVSLTRCRELAVVGPVEAPRPFSRISGLFGVVHVVVGTLAGVAGALRSAWQLWRLPTTPGDLRPTSRPVARVAYLKTNLWFGLKAGGSVGHVAGVVNALARHGVETRVFAVEAPPMLDAGVPVTEVPNAGSYGYPYELSYYAYEHRFVAAVRTRSVRRPPTCSTTV